MYYFIRYIIIDYNKSFGLNTSELSAKTIKKNQYNMRSLKLHFLFLGILVLTSCNDQPGKVSKKQVFKRSYISLMPGNEPDDLRDFAPLHPSVVAWGSDPISVDLNVEKFSKDISVYHEIGLPLVAGNVWMLTATNRYMYEHPEYQKAVCYDIEGNPIVPGWLDSDYKGVLSYWGCTNNPLYRSLLKKRAEVVMKSGADMLHLDDHMGTCAAAYHNAGCFCKYCMTGFRDWLKNNYDTKQLDSMGITDIDKFWYADVVKAAGFTTRESCYGEKVKESIPLYDQFLAFQRSAIRGLVKELGELADSIAGKHVPVGVNAWNLIPTQFATSQYADYFCNEVQHYDVADLIPPFSYMLGNALHKPLFSTGTGEDWVKIKQKESFTRIRRWISTAYAFGNYFMYAYNQWGFSEKTGTQWYRFPMEAFEPYSSFIHNNSFLFDDYEEFKYTAVLYDNRAFRLGDISSREISRVLHYDNIPVELAIKGDEWLQFDLTPQVLNDFEYLIIPEKTEITPELGTLFEKFSKNNKLIRWSENLDIKALIPSPVKVSGAEKVWALPRVKPADDGSREVVVHLLNEDYDAGSDKMNIKSGFKLDISNRILGEKEVTSVSYYAPGKEKVKAEFVKNDSGVTVTIPELNIWGIVKIN